MSIRKSLSAAGRDPGATVVRVARRIRPDFMFWVCTPPENDEAEKELKSRTAVQSFGTVAFYVFISEIYLCAALTRLRTCGGFGSAWGRPKVTGTNIIFNRGKPKGSKRSCPIRPTHPTCFRAWGLEFGIKELPTTPESITVFLV